MVRDAGLASIPPRRENTPPRDAREGTERANQKANSLVNDPEKTTPQICTPNRDAALSTKKSHDTIRSSLSHTQNRKRKKEKKRHATQQSPASLSQQLLISLVTLHVSYSTGTPKSGFLGVPTPLREVIGASSPHLPDVFAAKAPLVDVLAAMEPLVNVFAAKAPLVYNRSSEPLATLCSMA